MNDRSTHYGLRAILSIVGLFVLACAAAVGATAKRQAEPNSTSQPAIEGRPPAGQMLNAGRSARAWAPTAFIAPSLSPQNTQRPAISGTARVGQMLTVSSGQWTGNPGSFAYQWMRCDQSGNGCANVAGASASRYGVRSDDSGKTIRIRVTAANSAGSASVTTDRSVQIQPAPIPVPIDPCGSSRIVAVSVLRPPMRMVIDRWSFAPSVVRRGTRVVTARIRVTDTCGRAVTGAQVWSTPIPYSQTSTAGGSTAANGWVTLRFRVLRGFPANPGRQQIMAVLIRATRPGGSVLAGVSTRRVVRLAVRLS